MKITRLETIRLGRHPDSLWLRIHTKRRPYRPR